MTPNSEELRLKMARWVEHLQKVRIFRRLKVNAEIKGFQGSIGVTVSDGLVNIDAPPFHFDVRTMDFDVLRMRIEEMLVESFRAHVRTMIAPELVLEGTFGVKITNEQTDGEERYVFQGANGWT